MRTVRRLPLALSQGCAAGGGGCSNKGTEIGANLNFFYDFCGVGVRMEGEVQRCEAMWALRQAFRKRVRKQNGGSGGCMAAFEKWHYAVLRRAEAHQCDQPADPLLPSADVCDLMDTEQVLATELELEGLSSAAAESVAAWQRKQYAKGAKALRQKLRRRQGSAETGAQLRRRAGAGARRRLRYAPRAHHPSQAQGRTGISPLAPAHTNTTRNPDTCGARAGCGARHGGGSGIPPGFVG